MSDRPIRPINERFDPSVREASMVQKHRRGHAAPSACPHEKNTFCWRTFSTMRLSIVGVSTHPCLAASFRLRLTPFVAEHDEIYYLASEAILCSNSSARSRSSGYPTSTRHPSSPIASIVRPLWISRSIASLISYSPRFDG